MFYVYSSVLVSSVCNSGSGAERPLTVRSQSSRTNGHEALLTRFVILHLCQKSLSVLELTLQLS